MSLVQDLQSDGCYDSKLVTPRNGCRKCPMLLERKYENQHGETELCRSQPLSGDIQPRQRWGRSVGQYYFHTDTVFLGAHRNDLSSGETKNTEVDIPTDKHTPLQVGQLGMVYGVTCIQNFQVTCNSPNVNGGKRDFCHSCLLCRMWRDQHPLVNAEFVAHVHYAKWAWYKTSYTGKM